MCHLIITALFTMLSKEVVLIFGVTNLGHHENLDESAFANG